MAFCHRIILSHGGQIRLDQSDASGTCFRITLPVAAHPTSETDKPADHIAAPANLRALIVDDEVDVGELNAEILRREGFDVEFVSTGEEALKRLHTSNYDIFLSDLNMPDIDGRKIYETLVSQFPTMLERTAYITGDTMGLSSRMLLTESGLPYLEKPVSPAELRDLVATLLVDKKDLPHG